MSGLSIVRELLGSESTINMKMFLSRSEPEDFGSYRRAFGIPIHFGADQTALCFPRKVLDRPVISADLLLRHAIEERLNAVWHAGTLDPLTLLRRTIRVGLLDGGVSAEQIARKLGMSRRSLHRRLAAFPLRFHDILDETRCGFAQQLLVNTRLSISDISGIVGFADPSILTRSFNRWTGHTPTKWRHLHQAQPSLE
jgi:AraC-like DNA-binding protein